jgi:hypothetical protein
MKEWRPLRHKIFVPYKRYVSVLKWLTLSLFAYFGTVMVVHIPWGEMAGGVRVTGAGVHGKPGLVPMTLPTLSLQD